MVDETYIPQAWFWIVGDDETRFWSSAAAAYVGTLPENAGITRIASEAELSDVLRPYGLPGPAIGIEDYKTAIVARLDATAQSRLYDNAVSIATYVSSTIPAWAIEAMSFVTWRDAVWAYAYTELDKVMAGEREQPSVEELISELPVIAWPA